VTYERLEGFKSLQWPVAPDGTDQPLLYTKQFAFPDGKARLLPVSFTQPQEQASADFDFCTSTMATCLNTFMKAI
jgi:formate dehydrogenase major subunit